jgi:hypothetical protein
MKNADVIRGWKDEEYRLSLSDADSMPPQESAGRALQERRGGVYDQVNPRLGGTLPVNHPGEPGSNEEKRGTTSWLRLGGCTFRKCKQFQLAGALLSVLLFSTTAQAAAFQYANGALHFAYEDYQGVIHDAQLGSTYYNWTVYQVNLKNINSAAGTNGPPAAGDPFVSQSIVGNAYHLRYTYRDGTGAIQDVLMPSTQPVFFPDDTGGLQQINLRATNSNARTAGPAAVGNPFVLNVGSDKHFVYRDSSGTIWDAWYNGTWTLQQINSTPSSQLCGPFGCFGFVPGVVGLTNGPSAAGDPFVVAYGQQLHYVYRDANGNIQDAWYDGASAWHLDQINSAGHAFAPQAAGDPFVLVLRNPGSGLTELHYIYRDAKGDMFDAYYNGGGTWGTDWVACCSAKAPSGPVATFYAGELHVVYSDLNGGIHDAWHRLGDPQWTVSELNLGGLTNGPAAAVPSATVTCPDCGGTLDSLQGLSAVVDPEYRTYSVNGTCTDFLGNTTMHVGYRDVTGAIQHIWYDGASSWHQEEVFPKSPPPCVYPLKLNGPSNPLTFQTGTAVSGITFSASGGTPPYRFSASGLPADGLSLSPGGALTGTPTAPETFNIIVTVTDSANRSASNPSGYTITVKTPPLVLIPPPSLSFTVGTALSGVNFTASGGIPPYTFSTSTVDGLSLSSTGALTGTPAAAGSFPISVTVRDGTGTTASGNFTITASTATWTLSLQAGPVPLYVSVNGAPVGPINIDTITWVVSPDWNPNQSPISFKPASGTASRSVAVPIPTGSVKTVTVTISGQWSFAGMSGSISSSGVEKVVYKGTNETIAWILGADASGVHAIFQGVTP